MVLPNIDVGRDTEEKYLYINSLIHAIFTYLFKSTITKRRSQHTAARILCRSFTLKQLKQLGLKDLPKVPTWLQERGINPRPFGRKSANLPNEPSCTPHISYHHYHRACMHLQ